MIQAFTWVLNSLVLCILGKRTTFWMFTWVFCSLELIYFVIRTKKEDRMKRIIKLFIVAMTLCLLAGCANSEKDQVMKEYEEERARIEKQKEILDEEIAESERLLE